MKWTFHDDLHALHGVEDNLLMEVCKKLTFQDDDWIQEVVDSFLMEADNHSLAHDVDLQHDALVEGNL